MSAPLRSGICDAAPQQAWLCTNCARWHKAPRPHGRIPTRGRDRVKHLVSNPVSRVAKCLQDDTHMHSSVKDTNEHLSGRPARPEQRGSDAPGSGRCRPLPRVLPGRSLPMRPAASLGRYRPPEMPSQPLPSCLVLAAEPCIRPHGGIALMAPRKPRKAGRASARAEAGVLPGISIVISHPCKQRPVRCCPRSEAWSVPAPCSCAEDGAADRGSSAAARNAGSERKHGNRRRSVTQPGRRAAGLPDALSHTYQHE